MNYFPFHIGDYVSATRHLSWEEDCAFRRLLDVYYTTEKAIPADLRQAFRLVMATSESQREAVEQVLNEFFVKTDAGWVNKRADEELAAMREKQQKQRDKANKRWSNAANQNTAMPRHEEDDATASKTDADAMPPTPTPTPTPTPKNKDSVAKATGVKPPMQPDEIIFGYGVPLLVNAGNTDKAARAFLGGLRKGHGDDALIDSLRECLKAKPLQPLEWLAARLPPASRNSASKHSGFSKLDYREGVSADGSLA